MAFPSTSGASSQRKLPQGPVSPEIPRWGRWEPELWIEFPNYIIIVRYTVYIYTHNTYDNIYICIYHMYIYIIYIYIYIYAMCVCVLFVCGYYVYQCFQFCPVQIDSQWLSTMMVSLFPIACLRCLRCRRTTKFGTSAWGPGCRRQSNGGMGIHL